MKLDEDERALLQMVPYCSSLDRRIPTGALVYRLDELIQVDDTTIKTLVEEEFDDSIIGATDFSMDIQRRADPRDDRVVVTFSGKFLPRKTC